MTDEQPEQERVDASEHPEVLRYFVQPEGGAWSEVTYEEWRSLSPGDEHLGGFVHDGMIGVAAHKTVDPSTMGVVL